MDFEEKQVFAQDTFTELDILEARDKHVGVVEEVVSGFGLDSE